MAQQKGDNWSSQAYQHAAGFVPKLAGKVVQWLDVQPNDVILDIGCGDGVLDLQFAQTLAKGNGSLHGIDASPSMIETSKKAVKEAGITNCTFEVLNATAVPADALPKTFTKAFSNAALHWILRAPATRAHVFTTIRDALLPGSPFVLEMGGLGNCSEMRTALLMATSRRIGLEKANAADPWFFPDEIWLTRTLEEEVGGWKVEKVEREWRPTKADAGGVEGWIRLMGKEFLDAVGREKGEEEREACVGEVVEVLREVCRDPNGGEMFSYVRLRCLARKL